MLVVTQRDQIERALGSQFAHKRIKTAFAENLIDRANPVGPFRMAGRRQMVEAGGMCKEKRHALSGRVRRAFGGEWDNLRGHRPFGKSRAGAKDQRQGVETVIPGWCVSTRSQMRHCASGNPRILRCAIALRSSMRSLSSGRA